MSPLRRVSLWLGLTLLIQVNAEPNEYYVRDGIPCLPVFNCEKGHSVEPCTKHYTKETCNQCPVGMHQSHRISSMNSIRTCFRLDAGMESTCKRYTGTVPSREKCGAPGCSYRCECDVNKGYWGKNACACSRRRKPCGNGHFLENSDGSCLPCPEGTYKLHHGWGSCFFNETFYRKTRPRQPTALPLHVDGPVSTAINITRDMELRPADNNANIANSLMIGMTILASAIVVMLILIFYYNRVLYKNKVDFCCLHLSKGEKGESNEAMGMIADDEKTIATQMTSISVNENNGKLNTNECDTNSCSSNSSSDSGIQLCTGNKEPMSTSTLPSNFILTSEESAGLSHDKSTFRRPSDETVIISNEQNASFDGNLPTFVQRVDNSMIAGNLGEMCDAPEKALQITERPAVFSENIKILNVQPTDSLEPASHVQEPNTLQTLLSARDSHFTVNLKEQSLSTDLCDSLDEYHIPNQTYGQSTKLTEEDGEETQLLKLASIS